MDQDETPGQVGRPRPWGQAPRSPFPVQPGLEPGSPLRMARGAMRIWPLTTDGGARDRWERQGAEAQGTAGGKQPLVHRPCSVLRGRAERLRPDGLRASGACCPALHGVAGSSTGLLWARSAPRPCWGKCFLPPGVDWRFAVPRPHPLAVARGSLQMFPGSPPRQAGSPACLAQRGLASGRPSRCLLPPSDRQQARRQEVPRAPAHQDRIR